MGDRFRMILRRKPGCSSTSSSVRCRRNVVPPKKDDLSVLTWKEQQMIEKAQLASLKTATQTRVQSKRGRPRKYPLPQADGDSDSSSVSSEEITDSNEDAVSDSPSTPPPPLSPLSVFTSGSKMSRGGRGKSSKNGTRRSSSRRSPSGQSLGSIGSFPDLLSPYLPTTTTSGGFAARKSAYTGVIGGSDDEDDGEYATRRRTHLAKSFFRSDHDSSDEDGATNTTPRRLPSEEFMPTTEDFISYLVLKGVNCVPEELKYIGSLPWETVPLKRKSNSSNAKKANEGSSTNLTSPVSPAMAPAIVKPEQAWAKKAIERAKRSLVVQTGKQRSDSFSNASISAKISKFSSSNGAKARSQASPERSRPSETGKPIKEAQKGLKQSLNARNSKQKGSVDRIKSPPSKKLCQRSSKGNCR